jgi:hypothetical protein
LRIIYNREKEIGQKGKREGEDAGYPETPEEKGDGGSVLKKAQGMNIHLM